jgi:hypothetical protein
LKLAGTTHGLGWATNAALNIKDREQIKISFIVLIIIHFNLLLILQKSCKCNSTFRIAGKAYITYPVEINI